LPEEWKKSIIVPIYKKRNATDFSNYMGVSLLSDKYKILSNILLSRLIPYVQEINGKYQCGFRSNIIYSAFIKYLKKRKYNEAVHRLFVDFKKAYDSTRREDLYNILIEFGIPMKMVRLLKMCLNETYRRVRVGKHLSGMFPVRNGLKQ
jgi:hypothetical protein